MPSKKLSRIIAALMLVFAIGFVAYALCHPTAGFPWSLKVTYTIYAVYILVMVILFIAPWRRKT